jgi:hypothetical protein
VNFYKGAQVNAAGVMVSAAGISNQNFEGESHAQYYRDINAPETKEYNMEVAGFFDRHLGR